MRGSDFFRGPANEPPGHATFFHEESSRPGRVSELHIHGLTPEKPSVRREIKRRLGRRIALALPVTMAAVLWGGSVLAISREAPTGSLGDGRSLAAGWARDGNEDGHAESLLFGSPQNLPVAGPAFASKAADLDGDGLVDLAVAGNGYLSVYWGGVGGLDPRTDIGTSAVLTSVASADFDKDGAMDLAVSASYSPSAAYVFFGNGDRTFGTPVGIGTYHDAVAIKAADLNGDGHDDLAIGNYDANEIAFFWGSGDGTFSSGVSRPVPSSPTEMCAGDFNCDGLIDLAVTARNSGLSILLGDWFSTHATYLAGDGPTSVDAADFNSDGVPDLVVANRESTTLSLFLGLGGGDFQPGTNPLVGYGVSSVAATDLNSDGFPDIAATINYAVLVLLGDGSGSFAASTSYPVGSDSEHLTLADFDSDGRTDVAVASLAVLPNIGPSPAPPASGWRPYGLSLTPSRSLQTIQALDQNVVKEDGEGGVIVAWVDKRSGVRHIYAQRVDASGAPLWQLGGVRVCSAPGHQASPAVESDGQGGAIVAWEDLRGADQDIYGQRISSAGELLWAAGGIPICTAPGDQSSVRTTTLAPGITGVVWQDGRSTESAIYAQSVNSTGAVLWAADGSSVCTAAGSKIAPSSVEDGVGGMIVAWEDNRWESPRVYLQRLDSMGSLQWTSGGVAVHENYPSLEAQRSPRIVSDHSSGVVVVWEDTRYSSVDIFAQRIVSDGYKIWYDEGVPVCRAIRDQIRPQVASDGSGGAIISWQDGRRMGDDGDIYAQRIHSGSSPLWAYDGVPLCTAPGPQRFPDPSRNASAIFSDGAGGAVVTWHDARAGANIRAQRITSSGEPLWAPDGEGIDAPESMGQSPAGVSDRTGGLIVTWLDDLGCLGSPDLFVTRIAPQGGRYITSVEQEPSPFGMSLGPNLPNPFNPATRLAYTLAHTSHVSLQIFDPSGRMVVKLVEGVEDAGSHVCTWRGVDGSGAPVPSGVYYASLRVNGQRLSRKLVLVR